MPPKPSNPDLCEKIIEIFNRHRVKTPEEGWAWQNIQLEFYYELLADAIKFSDGIPKDQQRLIVRKAASLANNENPISIVSLMREIAKLEKLFLQKPVESFAIVTSISLTNNLNISRRHFGATTLNFYKGVPNKYEHASHVAASSRTKTKTPPDGYTSVVAHCTGRSVVEAFNEAMNSLDLLRGIWNWLLSLKYPVWRWTSQTQPFNEIRGGPYHTAHFPDGKSAAGTYWYEPTIQERTIRPTSIAEEIWAEILFAEKYVRRKLRQTPSGETLTHILRDYARILDSCDYDGAFLGLWRLLEQLTLRESEQGNKDKIPRRVSFLFKDPGYVREAILFLNKHRDNSIHSGEGNPQNKVLIEELRIYVNHMIRFHLEEATPNRTFDDSIDLLCLTLSPSRLRKEIDIRQRALRFLESSGDRTDSAA